MTENDTPRVPCGFVRLSDVLAEVDSTQLSRQDIAFVLSEVLGMDRAALIAHPHRAIHVAEGGRIRRAIRDFAAGTPMAYLLGSKPFHGIELSVGPDVLIPRDDTETLVEAVLSRLDSDALRVLDLGSGSGAIGLALLAARPTWLLCATDVDGRACERTQKNAAALGLASRCRVLAGNWYEALLGEFTFRPPYDVIVSNPPYIAEGDPEVEDSVIRHEPHRALFSGKDGLDALREVIAGAPSRLVEDGLLAVEHGHRQGDVVRDLFDAAGFRDVETLSDLAGRDRITLGHHGTASAR